jgi:hypothetical protein
MQRKDDGKQDVHGIIEGRGAEDEGHRGYYSQSYSRAMIILVQYG